MAHYKKTPTKDWQNALTADSDNFKFTVSARVQSIDWYVRASGEPAPTSTTPPDGVVEVNQDRMFQMNNNGEFYIRKAEEPTTPMTILST